MVHVHVHIASTMKLYYVIVLIIKFYMYMHALSNEKSTSIHTFIIMAQHIHTLTPSDINKHELKCISTCVHYCHILYALGTLYMYLQCSTLYVSIYGLPVHPLC